MVTYEYLSKIDRIGSKIDRLPKEELVERASNIDIDEIDLEPDLELHNTNMDEQEKEVFMYLAKQNRETSFMEISEATGIDILLLYPVMESLIEQDMIKETNTQSYMANYIAID